MNNFADTAQINESDGEEGVFHIRWRGRQEGPYSLPLIENKLTSNEIGLAHEILTNEGWITIRQYLADRSARLHAEFQAKKEQARRENEERERIAKQKADESRAALLAEERRKNDLLAEAVEYQVNMVSAASSQVWLKPHRGGEILILALFGFFLFPPFCLAAWIMGSSDLREMNAGVLDSSGQSMTNTGTRIGKFGSILWVIGIPVFFLVYR